MHNLLKFLPTLILLISAMTAGLLLNILFGIGPFVGIIPRRLNLWTPARFILSAFVHNSSKHLLQNLTLMVPAAFVFLLLSPTPIRDSLLMLLMGASVIWLLGTPNTYHIGASGYVYSLLGYCSSHFYLQALNGHSLNYVYLIAFYAYAGASIVMGLIPNNKTSFSGHLGGFLAGLVLPVLLKNGLIN